MHHATVHFDRAVGNRFYFKKQNVILQGGRIEVWVWDGLNDTSYLSALVGVVDQIEAKPNFLRYTAVSRGDYPVGSNQRGTTLMIPVAQ